MNSYIFDRRHQFEQLKGSSDTWTDNTIQAWLGGLASIYLNNLYRLGLCQNELWGGGSNILAKLCPHFACLLPDNVKMYK